VSGLALKIEQRNNLRAGSPAALFNYLFCDYEWSGARH
jgi:hypothetical protein